MRCRKVHFYLSAYCHDELDGDKRIAVEEHLADCAACRKEEAVFRSLNKAAGELDTLKVSDNFNNLLLNRIANERFAETRTKAHFPKRAPFVSWTKAVPVVVTACLMIFVAISAFKITGENQTPAGYADKDNPIDYINAEPINNPNLTGKMDQSWTLDKQMERVERINRITNQLQQANNFHNSGLSMVSSQRKNMVPFSNNYFRVRRVQVAPSITTTAASRGGTGVY